VSIPNNNFYRSGDRKEKQMNVRTMATSIAVLVALGLALAVSAAEPPRQEPGGLVNLAVGCPVAAKAPGKTGLQ
jgi:hypothetical protein